MKDIHIVLLNYCSADDIIRALTSMMPDIASCSYDVAVTVVDNSQNQDGLKEKMTHLFPDIQYLALDHNIGFGRGNVAGFTRVPARYYFALNPDTVFPVGSRVVDRIVRFLDERRDIGCIGIKLLDMDGTVQHSCYRFDLSSILIKPFKHLNFDKKYAWVRKHTDKLEMKDFDHTITRPVDWVLGAAMIVRQEVVDAIGWFDEQYFMYFEDCDWCRRMWESSWPVYYVHEISIMHEHTRESAKVPGWFKAIFTNKLARQHASSWVKYLWKWRHTHRHYTTKL